MSAGTALLVIDMQQGCFDGVRWPPIAAAEDLLARVGSAVTTARGAGLPVLFVRHGEAEGLLVPGTPQHALHPTLAPRDGEAIVDKTQPDAFAGTTLQAELGARGVRRLLLCGLQSECCVSATARAALAAGYEVQLLGDAHGTWPAEGPQPGQTKAAEQIRAEVTAALQAAGAGIVDTACLRRELQWQSQAPLFESQAWRVYEIERLDVPLVQRLFDDNPGFAQLINGRRPLPNEAQIDFDERPPPGLSYTRTYMLGVYSAPHELEAVIELASDLVTAGCWHVSLFFVATRHHGHGQAHRLFESLEGWIQAQGARWMRLVVAEVNRRALRFWRHQGFEVLRWRHAVDTGGRLNDMRVLLKPMPGQDKTSYLALVPRDRPDPAS